ncbi:hypothetical protein HPP92_004919 [Vanilla planifolia]|uniref:Uncharacterized protein n=1 Tax=Vanilla planifolia TaxID=51239 RepID=A0A835RKE3_VANPL|nr:hypothetical protein HPP92_004919 [Vanilla planifolia]
MALCAFLPGWKSEPSSGTIDALGYLDGLLGIIVDHRLRRGSEEAKVVQERVMKMGKMQDWVLPIGPRKAKTRSFARGF